MIASSSCQTILKSNSPTVYNHNTNFQVHIHIVNGEFHIPELPSEKKEVTLSVDATDRGIPQTGFLKRARFTVLDPNEFTTLFVAYVRTVRHQKNYVDAGSSYTFKGKNFTPGSCLELSFFGHHATHVSTQYKLTRPLEGAAKEIELSRVPEGSMIQSTYRVTAAAASTVRDGAYAAANAATSNCSIQ